MDSRIGSQISYSSLTYAAPLPDPKTVGMAMIPPIQSVAVATRGSEEPLVSTVIISSSESSASGRDTDSDSAVHVPSITEVGDRATARGGDLDLSDSVPTRGVPARKRRTKKVSKRGGGGEDRREDRSIRSYPTSRRPATRRSSRGARDPPPASDGGISLDAYHRSPLTYQPTSFVSGAVPNFWECPMCLDRPPLKRARHSVLFFGGADAPTIETHPLVAAHILLCTAALCAPPSDTASGGEGQRVKPSLNGGSRGNRVEERGKAEDAQKASANSKRGRKRQREEGNGGGVNSSLLALRPECLKSSKKNAVRVERFFQHDTALTIKRASVSIVQKSPDKDSPPLVSEGTSLANPPEDRRLTASVDIIILSQVARCHYDPKVDDVCRSRAQRSGFAAGSPGIRCLHCDRRWFFKDAKSLARIFARIEEHILQCGDCPDNTKEDVQFARGKQVEERAALREGAGDEGRSQYTRLLFSEVVWRRLHS